MSSVQLGMGRPLDAQTHHSMRFDVPCSPTAVQMAFAVSALPQQDCQYCFDWGALNAEQPRKAGLARSSSAMCQQQMQ